MLVKYVCLMAKPIPVVFANVSEWADIRDTRVLPQIYACEDVICANHIRWRLEKGEVKWGWTTNFTLEFTLVIILYSTYTIFSRVQTL